MKKICLIYTGYLRTWELCWPNHMETFGINGWPLENRNFYIYFYTYEMPGHCPMLSQSKQFSWVGIPEPFYPNPFAEHKYNARKVPENTVCQTLNQWINNFIGFRLVPKGYDIYVRVRTDLKFNGRLNFNDYDCSGNTIYIPQGMDFGGINDQFAFGNYEVMKTYYSVLFNCHQLWEDGVTWHSEGMQLANLQRNNINIVRFGSPQHDIIR